MSKKLKKVNSLDKVPCEFDHNGECLICDCWFSECAYNRLLSGDYSHESQKELLELFKDYLTDHQISTIKEQK